MHPAASLVADRVVKHHQLLAPLLFSVVAAVGHVHTPVQHSLFVTAISWTIAWVPMVLGAGICSNSDSNRRNMSWLIGALLALSQICDRAACDKQGTWTTKVDMSPGHGTHTIR